MNSGKWTAFAIGYQCVYAYLVSLMVYNIGSLFTGDFAGGLQLLWLVLAFVALAGLLFMLFRPGPKSLKKTKK